MTRPLGETTWAIAGGHMPLESTGPEPEFTSRDTLSVLNTSEEDAILEITIYHTDKEPIGPYQLEVGARRMRRVRFNDLIDPEAIPLCVDYAAVIESNTPVVVQFSHTDTRRVESARAASLAFSE